MSTQPATIVQRLWNYCNVLRDDGVSYGDYVEQLTYLLFLKMADEQEHELGKTSAIPAGLGWESLRRLDGDALERQYPGFGDLVYDRNRKVPAHINIYLNNQEIHDLDGVATKVSDGDQVAVIPALAGGADGGDR